MSSLLCRLCDFSQVNNTAITFRGNSLVNGTIIVMRILIVIKLVRQLLLRFQVSHVRLAELWSEAFAIRKENTRDEGEIQEVTASLASLLQTLAYTFLFFQPWTANSAYQSNASSLQLSGSAINKNKNVSVLQWIIRTACTFFLYFTNVSPFSLFQVGGIIMNPEDSSL